MTAETFALNHATLADSELIALPAEPISPLRLFVCTYAGLLAPLSMDVDELTNRLCKAPHGVLRAINSNYGHAYQPGFAHLAKTAPPPPPPAARPARGRPRKGQGDGTCFNSAVEPIIELVNNPAAFPNKVYKTKVFSSTGETQVPGVLSPDLSDGHAALEALVAYLNELGVGDSANGTIAPPWAQMRKVAEDAARAGDNVAITEYRRLLTEYTLVPPPGPRMLITIAREGPKMLNYKFRINRSSPRMFINLAALATYLGALETIANVQASLADLTPKFLTYYNGIGMPMPNIILPPFPVRETNPPMDDVKVSFRFRCPSRSPRVNVFQGGKVNILGADSVDCADQIYEFFNTIFRQNWNLLVCLQPRRDKTAVADAASATSVTSASAALATSASAASATAASATAASATAALAFLAEVDSDDVFDE